MTANNSNSWLIHRRLRVCVWNPTPKMAGSSSNAVEQQLRNLGSIELVQLKSLDDPQLHPCDLLVLTASYVEEENFAVWLKGVEARLEKQASIKIPALVYAQVELTTQRELLQWAIKSNWYFDIVHPDHLSSIPLRIANFLRLHDHLHEVARMQNEVTSLSKKVAELEDSVRRSLTTGMDGSR